jgi:hypothetical protein
MTIYELHGKLTEAHSTLNIEYDKLLSVLAAVKSEDISIDKVEVDLEKRSWSIAEDKTEKETKE